MHTRTPVDYVCVGACIYVLHTGMIHCMCFGALQALLAKQTVVVLVRAHMQVLYCMHVTLPTVSTKNCTSKLREASTEPTSTPGAGRCWLPHLAHRRATLWACMYTYICKYVYIIPKTKVYKAVKRWLSNYTSTLAATMCFPVKTLRASQVARSWWSPVILMATAWVPSLTPSLCPGHNAGNDSRACIHDITHKSNVCIYTYVNN